MGKKAISNTFTVNTIDDGESAPFYDEEWYAWSNDATTASVTKEPYIADEWSHTIPAQGSYAYLWKKIVRYEWNENTRTYVEGLAQYFRMSGENGTSINVKGTIDYAYSSSSVFPPASSSLSGKKAVAKEDNRIWKCQGVAQGVYAWTPSGSTASDGFSYTVGEGNFNGTYQSTSNLTGHLVMWSAEAEDWVDLGQFKGEAGVTYYTHIAWATNVDSSTIPITVFDFVTTKTASDTTHIWMGVLVDTNTGQDPQKASLYTWSNTKGNKGDRGNVGRFFYFAGVWDNIASSDSFEVSDAQAPYFQYGGTSATPNYWVFNPSSNGTYTKGQMGTPSSSSANWEQMTNDFKYIITEALFSKNAHLGSFVINGDWMISQHGTINGQESVNYTQFDPDHPNDNTGTNFIPNFCVDGLTGVTYQQNAHITGVVSAAMMYGTQLTVNNPNTSVKKYALDLVNSPANLFMCDPTMGNLVIVLPEAGDYDGITIRFFADGVTPSKTVTLQTYNSSVELYFKDMDNYVVGSWQHSNAMKMLDNEPYEASAINGEWYITQGIGKFGTYVS